MNLDRYFKRINTSNPIPVTSLEPQSEDVMVMDQNHNIHNQSSDSEGHAEQAEAESEHTFPSGFEMETDGDSDSSSNEAKTIDKQRKNRTSRGTKQKRHFKQEWILEDPTMSEWLSQSEKNAPFCTVCSKIISGGKTHVKRHANSAFHIKNWNAVKHTPKVINYVQTNKEKRLADKVKAGEFKMVAFLAEHNLPFLLLDHLPQFIASVCPDSQIAKKLKCGRKKGTNICCNILAQENIENVSSDLQSNKFSLIVDETTDVSVKKSLAIVCRYYRHDRVKDKFVGLIQVETATADGLYQSLCNYFDKLKIPLSNMIGFAADNAAVMMGDRNGLKTKLKDKSPDIYVLGCVCHSFHLCASAACLTLPRSVEELARDIVSYFTNSSKRIEELKECQVFANLEPHKLLKPSQTRWLSLQAVVDRIIEQWPALKLFFTSVSYEDATISAQSILGALNNPIFKLYFYFLSYVLDLINKLNVEFQSESPKIYMLLTQVSGLYRTILRNFIKNDYLKKTDLDDIKFAPANYLELDSIYCGANCALFISETTILKSDLDNFHIRCLDFYIELCKQIRSRFSFNDPILTFLQNLEPAAAISGNVGSLVPIMKRFPSLVPNIEKAVEKVNSEWRQLPDTAELKRHVTLPFEEFWYIVFNMKNGLDVYMFPNLTIFIKGLLSLPHSSATAERIFSQLSLIKTKTRNRLLIETCNSLLHTKELLDSQKCYLFEPSDSLLRRNINENVCNDSNVSDNLTF